MRQTRLTIGEPASWFTARSTNNANFHFDTIAGRYIVLCFFGSAAVKTSQRLLAPDICQKAIFDDQHCCFFGVSVDPEDEKPSRVQQHIPGLRFFWDFNGVISQQGGAVVFSCSLLHEATPITQENSPSPA